MVEDIEADAEVVEVLGSIAGPVKSHTADMGSPPLRLVWVCPITKSRSWALVKRLGVVPVPRVAYCVMKTYFQWLISIFFTIINIFF